MTLRSKTSFRLKHAKMTLKQTPQVQNTHPRNHQKQSKSSKHAKMTLKHDHYPSQQAKDPVLQLKDHVLQANDPVLQANDPKT
jgi:hypothetical protein